MNYLNLYLTIYISFKTITIHDTFLLRINESFFDGQQDTLTHLYIFKNKLGNDGFPYAVLSNLPNLYYLNLTDNDISTIPVLPPNYVTTLHFENNAIETIQEETFVNCQALKYLFLSSNSMHSIKPGTVIYKFQDMIITHSTCFIIL